ncbi:hypothetical protein EBR96_09140, partial [bacterium]|nr:hypothetical protein [bacterium]
MGCAINLANIRGNTRPPKGTNMAILPLSSSVTPIQSGYPASPAQFTGKQYAACAAVCLGVVGVVAAVSYGPDAAVAAISSLALGVAGSKVANPTSAPVVAQAPINPATIPTAASGALSPSESATSQGVTLPPITRDSQLVAIKAATGQIKLAYAENGEVYSELVESVSPQVSAQYDRLNKQISAVNLDQLDTAFSVVGYHLELNDPTGATAQWNARIGIVTDAQNTLDRLAYAESIQAPNIRGPLSAEADDAAQTLKAGSICSYDGSFAIVSTRTAETINQEFQNKVINKSINARLEIVKAAALDQRAGIAHIGEMLTNSNLTPAQKLAQLREVRAQLTELKAQIGRLNVQKAWAESLNALPVDIDSAVSDFRKSALGRLSDFRITQTGSPD